MASQKKKVLFQEEETEAPEASFRVNEAFAKRFEHNKRRELLDRGVQ